MISQTSLKSRFSSCYSLGCSSISLFIVENNIRLVMRQLTIRHEVAKTGLSYQPQEKLRKQNRSHCSSGGSGCCRWRRSFFPHLFSIFCFVLSYYDLHVLAVPEMFVSDFQFRDDRQTEEGHRNERCMHRTTGSTCHLAELQTTVGYLVSAQG